MAHVGVWEKGDAHEGLVWCVPPRSRGPSCRDGNRAIRQQQTLCERDLVCDVMTQVNGTNGYAEMVERFIEQTEAVDFYELHRPFFEFIPTVSSRVLDVGAGVGRDAAALASMGHNVVAVEPLVDFLAAAKNLHNSPNIDWVSDTLPMLIKLGDTPNQFHFVLASAVWHHIDDTERRSAMSRISQLLCPGGVFALSLRNGPAGGGTQVFPTDAHQTIEIAKSFGFETLLNLPNQPSLIKGKKDVLWTKLAFEQQ